MNTLHSALLPVALSVAALAGCGGDDDEPPVRAAATTPTPAATEAAALPSVLTQDGWETTTTGSDITDHDMAKDLRGPNDWRLEFHTTGGDANGPSVTLDNQRYGTMAHPLTVSGKRLVVSYGPPCEAFRWRVRGDKLTLTPVDKDCPSTSQSSIYASTWTRAR